MTTAVTADQIRNLINRAERGALTSEEASRLRAGVEELIRSSTSARQQSTSTHQPSRVRPLWLVADEIPTFSVRSRTGNQDPPARTTSSRTEGEAAPHR